MDKSEGQETFTKFHSLSLSKGTILTEETNLRAKKIFLEVIGIYEGPAKLAVSCTLGMLKANSCNSCHRHYRMFQKELINV